MDANEIFEKLEQAGQDWADKNSAADILEETKYTILSECMAQYPEDSNAAAETKARADKKFKEHLSVMVAARKAANKAKVHYESIKTWIELHRTAEATERAKMNLR